MASVNGIDIETLGASPSASAAMNYAAIQTALDIGGILRLTTPGEYKINAVLTIGDNTDFILGPGVKLIRTASYINMMTTKQYGAAKSPVSLSWSSGYDVTVSWPGHGKLVGDPICIGGADQSCFNGVVLVKSVVDADTLTYRTYRLPLITPTGNATAVGCNKNIKISGGIWDYNAPTYTGLYLTAHAMILGYVYNLTVEDIEYDNVLKFALNVGAVKDFKASNIMANSLSDIVKVYGPAHGVNIDGIHGIAGDDCVSIHTKEAAQFINYAWTFGDILGVSVKNICASTKGGGNIAVAYISTNEYLHQVHFDGIYGDASGTGCLVRCQGITNADKAGLITASKLGGHASTAVDISLGTYSRVSIKDMSANGEITNAAMVYVNATTTVRDLVIDGYSTPEDTNWNAGNSLNCAVVAGNVDTLAMYNIEARVLSSTRLLTLVSGASVQTVDIYAPSIVSSDNAVLIQAGVLGTPQVTIHGGLLQCVSALNSSSNASLFLDGVMLATMTNGVFRTGGTPTLTIAARNCKGAPPSWLTVPSGTPVVNVKGFDIQVDLSASYINRATGNYAYNTNAALGTLGAAGPVVCQGAAANSWRLQGDTTLQY